MAPYIGCDTEGTALKKKNKKTGEYEGTDYRDGTGFAYGISLAYRDFDDIVHKRYFPIKHTYDNVSDETFKLLRILLENHSCIIMHNAMHDLVALETLDIKVRTGTWYCTMHMAHFIDENLMSKSLDIVSKLLLGRQKIHPPEWDACLAIFGWTPKFPASVMKIYAAEDAALAMECWECMIKEFRKQGFDLDG